MNLSKIQKIEAHADYLQTVPADVRAVNEDKVRFLRIHFHYGCMTVLAAQDP
jgi:hypothetical protein